MQQAVHAMLHSLLSRQTALWDAGSSQELHHQQIVLRLVAPVEEHTQAGKATQLVAQAAKVPLSYQVQIAGMSAVLDRSIGNTGTAVDRHASSLVRPTWYGGEAVPLAQSPNPILLSGLGACQMTSCFWYTVTLTV